MDDRENGVRQALDLFSEFTEDSTKEGLFGDVRHQTRRTTGLRIRIPGSRASLVAQWLGIRLPMQGTRVRALVWEDPTCRGATRPVSHNC